MSNRAIGLATIASMLALTGGSATPATLDAVRGEVMVSRGDGFRPVKGAVELKAGDSVVVSGGGGATVRYSDSCKVPVVMGAVVIIGNSPPCAPTANNPATSKAPPAGRVAAGTRPAGLETSRMRLTPPDPMLHQAAQADGLAQKIGPEALSGAAAAGRSFAQKKLKPRDDLFAQNSGSNPTATDAVETAEDVGTSAAPAEAAASAASAAAAGEAGVASAAAAAAATGAISPSAFALAATAAAVGGAGLAVARAVAASP